MITRDLGRPRTRALYSWVGRQQGYAFSNFYSAFKVSTLSRVDPNNPRPSLKPTPASPPVRPCVMCTAEALPLDLK